MTAIFTAGFAAIAGVEVDARNKTAKPRSQTLGARNLASRSDANCIVCIL